jgi:DNA-directed RNA polymerase subunit RPC12/RpoP
MRTTSVFCAECLCGRYFESEHREYTCPNCKRIIILAWGTTDETHSEREQNSEPAEAAA